MAKILQFPSARMQGLSFLDDQLRTLLRDKGADTELMDYAAKTVSELYQRSADAENYSFTLNLPDSVDATGALQLQQQIQQGIGEIQKENHAIVVRLIAELALARVQLFQQQREADPT